MVTVTSQSAPLGTVCGKETTHKLGRWSIYSPILVWPFATWLAGFGPYLLVIAFRPATAARLMLVLVVTVLIVLAKGGWATHCRHGSHARIRGGKAIALESDRLRVVSGSTDTVKPRDEPISEKIEAISLRACAPPILREKANGNSRT